MVGIALLLLAIVLFLARRFYPSLFLFFGFVTNGYQLIPPSILMVGAPTDKMTDLALIYLIVALISRSKALWTVMRQEPVFRWVGLFVAFVALDGIYSLIAQGYELGGVLRIFRVNLFLLSFGVFFVVPTAALVRVLHTLAVITVIQCIVYLIQIPLNLGLLNSSLAGSEIAIHNASETGLVRFYNLPAYLTPVLFYYLFQFRCRTWLRHGLVLSVLLLTVLAPLHRSYIFTLLLVISLFVLLRKSHSQRILYLAILLIIGFSVSMVDVISSRLGKGITDFTNTFTTGKSLITTDIGDNTFAYRMAHLSERIGHVIQTPIGYVFGIGLLSEDTRQAQRLSFETGAHSQSTDQVSQIDTGDIAWSVLILRLGFIGTIVFVIMLIRFIRLFSRYQTVPFSTVGLLTLAVTFLTSFAGTELLMIPFRTLLVLLAVVVVKISQRAPSGITPIILEPNRPGTTEQKFPVPARIKIYTNDLT